jgi:hypothetical protein
VTCQNWQIISAKGEFPSPEEWRYLIWFDIYTSFYSQTCSADNAYGEITSFPLRHLWAVTVKTQNSQSLTSTRIVKKKKLISRSICLFAIRRHESVFMVTVC